MQALQTDALGSIRPREMNRFEVACHDSTIRRTLESRVRSGFGHHFDACIEGFMPDLATYTHVSGATGVIGFRGAADEPLFLESYLDEPVESVIRYAARHAILRSEVVEVGQFIVDDKTIVLDFFRDLAPFLQSRGYEWVCFTGTNRIRTLLTKVGFSGKPVAAASQDKVSDAAVNWGTYYRFEPRVIVGKLSDPQGDWITDGAV